MPNSLHTIRNHLHDRLEQFNQRNMDRLVERRDKNERETERRHKEGEDFEKLKKNAEKKPMGILDEDNMTLGTHQLHKKQKLVKSRVQHKRKDSPDHPFYEGQNANVDNLRENVEVSSGVYIKGISASCNSQHGKEAEKGSIDVAVITDKELQIYQETTQKLEQRLSAIEGSISTMKKEPFPQNDMQAAADILLLEDIKTPWPALEHPGPMKPPKVSEVLPLALDNPGPARPPKLPLEPPVELRGGSGENNL